MNSFSGFHKYTCPLFNMRWWRSWYATIKYLTILDWVWTKTQKKFGNVFSTAGSTFISSKDVGRFSSSSFYVFASLDALIQSLTVLRAKTLMVMEVQERLIYLLSLDSSQEVWSNSSVMRLSFYRELRKRSKLTSLIQTHSNDSIFEEFAESLDEFRSAMFQRYFRYSDEANLDTSTLGRVPTANIWHHGFNTQTAAGGQRGGKLIIGGRLRGISVEDLDPVEGKYFTISRIMCETLPNSWDDTKNLFTDPSGFHRFLGCSMKESVRVGRRFRYNFLVDTQTNPEFSILGLHSRRITYIYLSESYAADRFSISKKIKKLICLLSSSENRHLFAGYVSSFSSRVDIVDGLKDKIPV